MGLIKLRQIEGGGVGGGAVSSVFGRTGAVVKVAGDYAVADVTGAAPLASPALTGTPTAPTAAPGTNSTQLATAAFVAAAVAAAVTAILNGVSSAFDTLSEIATELGLKAPLASPVFTGNPTAPTASPGDNDTTIANTAFVTAAVAAVSGSATVGAAGSYSDHVDRSLYSGSFASDSDDFPGSSLDAAWSPLNAGGSTVVSVSDGRLYIARPSTDTAFDGPRGVVRAVPAGTWKYQISLACWAAAASNYHHSGVWARRAGGTPPNASNVTTDKCAGVGIGSSGGAAAGAGIGGLNCSTGSSVSTSGAFMIPVGAASTAIIQLEYDGTNINWYAGDGAKFTLYKSVNASSQLGGAPDSIILASYMWFDAHEQLSVFDYCWRVA